MNDTLTETRIQELFSKDARDGLFDRTRVRDLVVSPERLCDLYYNLTRISVDGIYHIGGGYKYVVKMDSHLNADEYVTMYHSED